jgi:ketosteroid isomerase-like protein
MTTADEIQALNKRWLEAEVSGDAQAMEGMTVDGFTLVGPLGFILDRQQWIARYTTGDLVTSELNWHDTRLSEYGDTAVEVGVQTQKSAYQGRSMDGSFRSTHVLVRVDGEWKLAALHLSPMPPAAPGNPAPGGSAPGK